MPPKKPTGPAGRLLSEFMPLLPAEEILREACRTGEFAWFEDKRPEAKTAENHIRPAVLRVFCLGLDPDAQIHERGVRFHGAWIEGDGRSGDNLDLSGCDLPRPLMIMATHFVGAVIAWDAKAKQLIFDGSRCAAISADRLTCSGSFQLRNGFHAEREVRFLGAIVGGDLDCSVATFAASDGNALSFDGAKIGGAVFLNGTFRAEGTVRFLSATIGGALVCTDATFAASAGKALFVDGAKIGGDVILSGTFLAERAVRFLGATIGGDLVCTDATFAATEDNALAFDGAKIGGAVFLNGTFRAESTVRFLGATVGDNLDCTDAVFAASADDALFFDRAKIGGTVFLDGTFRAESSVRFLGAAIGSDLACRGGQFASLALARAEISGSAYFDAGFHASGVVDFTAAEIAVFVDDEAAWDGATLVLDGLTVQRFAADAPVSAAARMRWLEHQTSDHLDTDFRPQPWEECARVLAEMGHERDARVLRIEKRRRMRWLEWHRAKTAGSRDALRRALLVWFTRRRKKRCGALTRRILAARAATHAGRVAAKFAKLPAVFGDFVLDLTTGYGRRPMKALVGLLGLWGLASVGYATLPPGVMAPADALVYLAPSMPAECRADWIAWQPPPRPDDLSRRAAEAPASGLALNDTVGPPYPPAWSEICPRRAPSEYSTFSPFAYALDVLLPIVDLRQENDWSPRVTDATGEVIAPLWKDATWGWGYVARWLEWVLILLGWALSGLLLGAVTGVIRRD